MQKNSVFRHAEHDLLYLAAPVPGVEGGETRCLHHHALRRQYYSAAQLGLDRGVRAAKGGRHRYRISGRTIVGSAHGAIGREEFQPSETHVCRARLLGTQSEGYS